jgi:hypothetical protein
MAITYNKTSPYYSTSVDNGYLDIINFRDIIAHTDDVLFEVTSTYHNRPDLLAYDLYGDVNLWWVFAVRNKSIIKDPTFDLVAGIKIYLPTLENIKTSIGE